jgi:hypothetical protein
MLRVGEARFHIIIMKVWGTRYCSWLRQYATSRKLAVSSPGIGGFFNLPNSSRRSTALGSTEPVTVMSTRNIPGGKKLPARRADNLDANCEPNV